MKFNELHKRLMGEALDGESKMNKWEIITKRMAHDYGYTTTKGEMLMTLSALCSKVGEVRLDSDNSMEGQIPDCSEFGTDFNLVKMKNRLEGLTTLFPTIVSTMQTHDLSNFNISSIPKLITSIRLGETPYKN